MGEQGQNNMPSGQNGGVEGFDDDFMPDDARPVCPRCLTVCNRLQYYCHNCGSGDAINPLTPYIGFVNIRFNYSVFLTMWRKIWYEKDTSTIGRLLYLFMITTFVPAFLVIGLPSFLIFKIPQPGLRKATIITLCIIAIVLLIFFVRYRLFTGLVSRPIRR